MPRLPHAVFIRRRQNLRKEWMLGGYAFTALSPTDQIALHDYFEPSIKLSPAVLAAHREQVTTRHPSLPSRAGKAYARIEPFLARQRKVTAVTRLETAARRGARQRTITVTSLVHEHISTDAIAATLISAAKLGKRDTDRTDDYGI